MRDEEEELTIPQYRNESLPQLIRWWQGAEPEGIESHVRFRIAVARALRERPEGLAFLKQQARAADLKRQGRALMELAYKECVDEEIIHYYLDAFDAAEPVLKWCALFCLRRIAYYPLAREAVEKLLDQEADLKGDLPAEAMLYLSEAFPESATTLIARGLQSRNHYVRGAACNQAWQKGLVALLPALKRLMSDPDQYIVNAATTAVAMLDFFRRHS